MQKQSFTTSHQQSHAEPLSEQHPCRKSSAHLPLPSSSTPVFIAEHDVIWYGTDHGMGQVRSPVQPLSPFQSLAHAAHWGSEWEEEKALPLCKHNPATARTLVCHGHWCSHTPKTQHHTGCCKEKELCPVQDLPGDKAKPGVLENSIVYLCATTSWGWKGWEERNSSRTTVNTLPVCSSQRAQLLFLRANCWFAAWMA